MGNSTGQIGPIDDFDAQARRSSLIFVSIYAAIAAIVTATVFFAATAASGELDPTGRVVVEAQQEPTPTATLPREWVWKRSAVSFDSMWRKQR
jgi:hypothetical protein